MHSFLLRLISQLIKITNAPILNDQSALLLAAKYRESQRFMEKMLVGKKKSNIMHTNIDQSKVNKCKF